MRDWDKIVAHWLHESSTLGILTTDAELTVRGWNHWLESHSSRPAADLIGQNLLDAYPELAERNLTRHYQNALAGQVQVLAQGFHHHLLPMPAENSQGSEMMLQSAQIAPLFDQERVIGTLTVIEDVTEQVQRETELRDSEARYRSLTEDVLDSSAVGMFILDSDLHVVWINRAIENYFGLQRKDIIGQNQRNLIRNRIKDIFEDAAQFADKVLATCDDNTYVEEFECHILPGEEREDRWLEHRSQPIKFGFYAGGRVELYYDVSERKRAQKTQKEYAERLEDMVKERTKELYAAQEQLVRQERLAVLGQMAGSVGHELRNPLAVISNATYLLRLSLGDADESIQEGLSMLSEECQRMKKIISDLLDFSRSRSPNREEIAVSALVAQALEKQAAPENVTVTANILSSLPPVCVDGQQIEQVLLNLVINAYQAMPEGGRLTVGAQL